MASIPIEVSARHIHITESDWTALFGDHPMEQARPLSQTGQFAATQRVTLRGPKGEMENVGIVGPARTATQVELSATDARHLGITPPVAESGSTENAASITVIGPQGEIKRNAAIIAQRHIHCTDLDATALGLRSGQIVSVTIPGKRGAVLQNVVVRTDPSYQLQLHLDTDEANACGVQSGMEAELIAQ